MSTITLTPELLDRGDVIINLSDLLGDIRQVMLDQIDQAITDYRDHDCAACQAEAANAANTANTAAEKKKPGTDHDVYYNTTDIMNALGAHIIEQLPAFREEIFADADVNTAGASTAPVRITELVGSMVNDAQGFGRQAIWVRAAVNGQRLYDLARDYQIHKVDDGHNISGFVRTADDSTWVITQVLGQLMDDLADGEFLPEANALFLDEVAATDSWIADMLRHDHQS